MNNSRSSHCVLISNRMTYPSHDDDGHVTCVLDISKLRKAKNFESFSTSVKNTHGSNP